MTLARAQDVPVTIIGGGSNLLIADQGIRGLVIRVRGGEVRQIGGTGARRRRRDDQRSGPLDDCPRPGQPRSLGRHPGTVGGAIYGNAHFQGRNIGDLVDAVCLLSRDGRIADVPVGDMEFAYDYSRLHRTGEIVVSADFKVVPGEPDRLRAVARDSLAYRKRTQPLAMPSAGCIFQNPAPGRDSVPEGIHGRLAHSSIARVEGRTRGHAHVSPTHGNFIVNEGNASAGEVRALIERCKRDVYRQYGVQLREEIVSMGFECDRRAGEHGRVRKDGGLMATLRIEETGGFPVRSRSRETRTPRCR